MSLLVLIAVLLAGSGYGIYRLVKVALKPDEFTEIVRCTNCGHLFKKTHTRSEQPPYVCEQCGERTAYVAYRCMSCFREFVNTHPQSAGEIECPHCYSTNVRQILELPPGVSEGDTTVER
jgi:DNA-directed RNA polymerase subunit RPC12/RpoP